MNVLFQVLTASEGDILWGLPNGTVKRDVHRNKFNQEEVRKSKGVLLISRSAMHRIYGEPRK